MSKPVIFDFYADWCKPCQNMMPLFDRLTEEFKDKIDFIKVNVDTDPEKRQAYGVKTIPCFVAAHEDQNGEIKAIGRKVGTMTYAELKELVDKVSEISVLHSIS